MTTPRAVELCDWLDSVTLPDGGPSFAIRFLDAAHDRHPEAATLLERLGKFVPDTGLVPVEGGSEGETMRALNFAPVPGTPASALLRPGVVEAELDRLAERQLDDGGWTVDFAGASPAAALEWRGYATVQAVQTLHRAGRLDL